MKFEAGKKANFAITQFFYVPEREGGRRDEELEDWFSVDENGLAQIARAAESGTLSNFENPKLLNQAIRACIALGSRSAYSMYMGMHFFFQNEQSPHETSVDNVWRSISCKFNQFRSWDFKVLYDLPAPLLLNDRPFADFTPRDIDAVAMPLGPRSLLIGSCGDSRNDSKMKVSAIKGQPEHKKIVDMVNHFSIEMARQWIVAQKK
ncbi:hypothetical protein [Cribrihabitans neustonicus]|uniref:hypothetical protein n=1 Tax=Cribrihabitans neustonicus TaxID=1429085 RepID=UPI003B5962B8